MSNRDHTTVYRLFMEAKDLIDAAWDRPGVRLGDAQNDALRDYVNMIERECLNDGPETPPLAAWKAVATPDGSYPNYGWLSGGDAAGGENPRRDEAGHWRFVLDLPNYPESHPYPLIVTVTDAGDVVDRYVARDWRDLNARLPDDEAAKLFRDGAAMLAAAERDRGEPK